MAFYTSAVEALILRLKTYYNGNAYNAVTNPGGLAAGGHRTNFVPALQDLSDVAAAVGAAADAAQIAGNQAAAVVASGTIFANVSGGPAAMSAVPVANIVELQSRSRNLLVGADFSVNPWQEGTVRTIGATTATYAADVWNAYRGGGVTGLTVTKQAVTGVPGTAHALRVQRTAGDTSVAQVCLVQDVETLRSYRARGKPVTLSFWARCGASFSAASNQLLVGMQTGTGTNEAQRTGYTGNTVVLGGQPATLTTSFQRFIFTAPATLSTSLTQIGILFTYVPAGTAGVDDWFEIALPQLETGVVATEFDYRSPGATLAECQRYICKSYSVGTAPGTASAAAGALQWQTRTAVAASTAGILRFGSRFPVEMKASPTVTLYSPTYATAGAIENASAGLGRTGAVAVNIGTAGFGNISVDNTSSAAIAADDILLFHFLATSRW